MHPQTSKNYSLLFCHATFHYYYFVIIWQYRLVIFFFFFFFWQFFSLEPLPPSLPTSMLISKLLLQCFRCSSFRPLFCFMCPLLGIGLISQNVFIHLRLSRYYITFFSILSSPETPTLREFEFSRKTALLFSHKKTPSFFLGVVFKNFKEFSGGR